MERELTNKRVQRTLIPFEPPIFLRSMTVKEPS